MHWRMDFSISCDEGLPWLYCKPIEFTVTQPEKYPTGDLQPGHTVNLTGVQYKIFCDLVQVASGLSKLYNQFF